MSVREFQNKKGKTYEVRFTYKDKYGLKQYYSKRGFKTEREAKKHEIYIKEKIRQGHVTKSKTLDEVFNEFKSNNTLQITTLNQYTLLYNKHIKKALGGAKINVLDYNKIQSFINDLSMMYSKSNVNNIAAVIKNIFVFAYNYGYIERIPFQKLSVSGKEKKKANKVISDQEFKELIKRTEKEAYRIVFYIAHFTGLRIGEILALERNDIDMINNTISVNKTLYTDRMTHEISVKKPKTETSNAVIPLPNRLKDILIPWLEKNSSDIVVCDAFGQHILPSKINNYLASYKQKYGIHITMHMFRHTYTTMLYRKGVDPKTAQALLRHKDFNTTMTVYTHIEDNELNSIINNIFN